jgi:WD40 repeat protein
LVLARDNVLDILDIVSGKQIARCQGHKQAVTALAFSPDGKLFASGSRDKSVILWDTATLKQLRKFSLSAPVTGVHFSNDGRILDVRQSDKTECRLDLATGKKLREVNLR